MKTGIDLKELERKAFRSTFQDGLWDIFLGLLLLAMSVGAFLSRVGLSEPLSMVILLGMELLAVLMFCVGKKRITVPRMGRIRFGPRRKKKLSKVRIVLAGSAVLGAAAFLVAEWAIGVRQEWLKFAFPAVWVANCTVVFSLTAYLLDFRRLYLYGVLFAMAIPADILLDHLTGVDLAFIAFGFPAVAILVIGTIVFIRFLRDYPIPLEEVTADATN